MFSKSRLNSYITTLVLITLLGAGLRLYKLGDYPGGFGQDEAVGTYDAWSLLTTGREHHGDVWPLSSRQFGDYPPSTPTFLTIPFVALLGPTELATRLPCALFNAFAVFFFGLLATRLFRSEAAGLFAAALLAVSPWNIYFSRFAVSVGFITFFQVTAMWMLHRLLTREKEYSHPYLMAAAVGFMLFMWTHEYLSQYLFAPFIIGIAMLLWCRNNWRLIFTIGGVYSVFMIAAILVRLQVPAASGRIQVHSILYAGHPVWEFLANYREYHSFLFLFNAPLMEPLQQIPKVAHINHFLSSYYIIGLAALIASVIAPAGALRLLGRPGPEAEAGSFRRAALLVIAWLVLAPVSGALFVQRMYTARVTHLLLGVLLVSGFGCAVAWHLLKRIPVKFVAPAFVVFFAAYLGMSTVKCANRFVQANPYFKMHFQYGMPEVMRYLAQQTNVRSVTFPRMLQGYIYHLLFTPVHPRDLDYREVSPVFPKEGQWKYAVVHRVGNYLFEQDLNPDEVAKFAALRHQVRDRESIWFDLYEHDGNWFVVKKQ